MRLPTSAVFHSWFTAFIGGVGSRRELLFRQKESKDTKPVAQITEKKKTKNTIWVSRTPDAGKHTLSPSHLGRGAPAVLA